MQPCDRRPGGRGAPLSSPCDMSTVVIVVVSFSSNVPLRPHGLIVVVSFSWNVPVRPHEVQRSQSSSVDAHTPYAHVSNVDSYSHRFNIFPISFPFPCFGLRIKDSRRRSQVFRGFVSQDLVAREISLPVPVMWKVSPMHRLLCISNIY